MNSTMSILQSFINIEWVSSATNCSSPQAFSEPMVGFVFALQQPAPTAHQVYPLNRRPEFGLFVRYIT